jgi:hypothetical protein
VSVVLGTARPIIKVYIPLLHLLPLQRTPGSVLSDSIPAGSGPEAFGGHGGGSDRGAPPGGRVPGCGRLHALHGALGRLIPGEHHRHHAVQGTLDVRVRAPPEATALEARQGWTLWRRPLGTGEVAKGESSLL